MLDEPVRRRQLELPEVLRQPGTHIDPGYGDNVDLNYSTDFRRAIFVPHKLREV